MRAVAARLLEEPAERLAAVDRASLAAAPPEVRADPVLAASMQAATRANLVHWLGRVLVDPVVPVPPAMSREGVTAARDLVRRGLDAGTLDTFRTGQNAAWQLWMDACFAATDDPALLRELLDHSARSIFGYVDESMASITALVESERAALTQSTHAQRLEAVALVLEGAPISTDVASTRLAHDVRRLQTAAILWTDPAAGDSTRLDRAAEAVGRAICARPLTVVATASSVWAWYATDDAPGLAVVHGAVGEHPQVRLALGSTAAGLDGFRRSHLEALAAQRLMLRAPDERPVASYDEVDVVALVAEDEERAHEFVARTLGALAGADRTLRETLRVFLREDASASRAARVLFTHRNTVLNRLGRAEELLPAPLAGRRLQVAVALEIVHWLGRGSG